MNKISSRNQSNYEKKSWNVCRDCINVYYEKCSIKDHPFDNVTRLIFHGILSIL